MKITRFDDGRARVFYSTGEYETLLECTPSVRFRNAQRLAAHSLRRKTIAGLRYSQFKRVETPYRDLWVINVEAKDSSDSDQSEKNREVWVSDDLVESIKQQAGRKWDTDKQFFNNSTSTLHNRMKETREAAATKTDKERFLKVSLHDGRRYFANHYLYRHNMDPKIVRQLGGWGSERSMKEYLKLPDDILAARLGEAGLLGTVADLNPGNVTKPSVESTCDFIEEYVENGNPDTKIALIENLQSIIDEIDGLQLITNGDFDEASDSVESALSNAQKSLHSVAEREKNSVKSMVMGIGSVIKHHSAIIALRGLREREWMRDDEELIDPASPSGAVQVLLTVLLGGVMIASMLALGNSLEVVVALVAVAGVISVVEQQAEPSP